MSHLKITIRKFIEWAYIPFERYVPAQTFRYGMCGGANTTLDILLYFITYNFILKKKLISLIFISISPHIAAFMIVFPITFCTGFWLSKYITFTQSDLHGRIQLFRYSLTVLVCILLNYILLKFFVEYCRFYPTVSKILTTIVVVIYSYFSQKHFTFRMKKEKPHSLPCNS
ncbi:MAG: GtrA family protein [Bacteroidota bacterium]|nr:GtrA family protein [Bacteroidota bacterium]MDP4205759.1 GtrA family protein [Bacteroidota bacterium]